MNSEYVAIVRNWLDSLPEGLGDIAYDWAMSHVNGHRGAPRPIIRKLKKHIPALLEQLGSHFPDEFNAEKDKIAKYFSIFYSTLYKKTGLKQKVLTNTGKIIEQQGIGRHDPCVVPRAVPIVEAMTALVIADYFLLNKIYKL